MRQPITSLDDALYDFFWVSKERRMAIAFAMFAGISLSQAIKLRWSDELELKNWRALFVLAKVRQSNKTDRVFWEDINGEHVEMASLPYVFGISTFWMEWSDFADQYRDCVPIDFTEQKP